MAVPSIPLYRRRRRLEVELDPGRWGRYWASSTSHPMSPIIDESHDHVSSGPRREDYAGATITDPPSSSR